MARWPLPARRADATIAASGSSGGLHRPDPLLEQGHTFIVHACTAKFWHGYAGIGAFHPVNEDRAFRMAGIYDEIEIARSSARSNRAFANTERRGGAIMIVEETVLNWMPIRSACGSVRN